jgi:hypothetical protein
VAVAEPQAPPAKAKPAVAGKVDPAAAWVRGAEWRGRVEGEFDMQCQVRVLRRSATTVDFRLEFENRAHYEIDCGLTAGGKLKVLDVRHTKLAPRTVWRRIEKPGGSGSIDGEKLVLRFEFDSRNAKKEHVLLVLRVGAPARK